MPKTLWKPSVREELRTRIGRLTPESRRLWGSMSGPQMLAHLTDWMLLAKGDLKAAPRNLPYRHPPLKHIIIYWLPFPKGVPTAPELLRSEWSDWVIERDLVLSHIQSFEKLRPESLCPDHPAFGKMTARQWGVLGYRHTDHHLRQFGV